MRLPAPLLIVAILAMSAAPASTARGAETPAAPSGEDRRFLEGAMQARIDALLAERSPAGETFRGGRFSRRFQPQTGGAWTATLHIDTAGPGEMTTERALVTLVPAESGRAFRINEERVVDTYRNLTRLHSGAVEFRRFEGVSLSKEGLRITAGAGSLYTMARAGRTERVVLAARDMAYTYEPPGDLERLRHSILSEKHRDDLEFTPERVAIDCDPATCEELLKDGFRGLAPGSLEGSDEPLKRSFQEYQIEEKRARGEDPFSGFRLPFEAGQRFVRLTLKRTGRDHYLQLRADSDDPREVSVSISGYGRLHWYHAEETRAGKTPAIALERRPDQDRQIYDLQDLSGAIEAGFGDGELLRGDVSVRLKLLKPAREIPFAFARFSEERAMRRETRRPRLKVNGVADGDGKELTWVRTGGASGLVILPQPAPAGSVVTLKMTFESLDSVYKLTPHFFYVARQGWLPFVHPRDIIRGFDLTVSVPKRFRPLTAATGVPVAEGAADATTQRFSVREALTFPALTFGGYKELVSRVKVATAAGVDIPVRVFVNRDSAIPPNNMQVAADRVATALSLFQQL